MVVYIIWFAGPFRAADEFGLSLHTDTPVLCSAAARIRGPWDGLVRQVIVCNVTGAFGARYSRRTPAVVGRVCVERSCPTLQARLG